MDTISNPNDLQIPSTPAEGSGALGARSFWIAVLLLTLAITGLVFIASVIARVYGDAFLSRRNDSIGELLMQEGDRLEKAGLADAALERYLQAVKARFAGGHNRIHTLKRIGFLYRDRGEYERAVEYLRQTITGAYVPTTSYFALVDALMRLDRLDEAESASRDWLQSVEGKDLPREQGRALYYIGRIAERRDDMPDAVDAYRKSDTQFGDELSAARLAEYYMEQENWEEARAALDRYFSRQPTGSLAEKMRSLRAQLLDIPAAESS